MGSSAGPASSIVGAGLSAYANIEKAMGTKQADEYQAAELDRAAEYGRLKATQTSAQMTQKLNQTLGNIDVIRAAAHDDPTLAPPLREAVERWRPLGRSFDPRVAVIKDTPGPLEILELGSESTV
jgi:hypothetical protein